MPLTREAAPTCHNYNIVSRVRMRSCVDFFSDEFATKAHEFILSGAIEIELFSHYGILLHAVY